MLTLKNITKKYGEKVVFENFSISFESGKVSAILGNSGVGKTTLLNIISGLVDFSGEVIPKVQKISYVFQSPRLIPHLTVLQNVEYVLLESIADKEQRQNSARKYLELAEIAHLEKCFPKDISGGEKQRVQLARAFAYDGELIIMDEPFSSLDIALKTRLIDLYSDILQKNNKTVLFVTHDPYEALTFADNIYILKSNQVKTFEIATSKKMRAKNTAEIDLVRRRIYEELNF